jgi:uncharacterized membrane protein YdcZ (DUF606 family)
MENILYTPIGSAGALVILILFVLNQLKRVGRDSLTYDFWNFVGGLLLVIYAILIESYPFLALNLVWTLISLRDTWKGWRNQP